jgi:hypothetical protein
LPSNLARPALDFYLRALPDLDAFAKNGLLRALDLLGQAIEHDPHYGPALALSAQCHLIFEVNGWVDDREAARRTVSISLGGRFARPLKTPTSSLWRLSSSDISVRTSTSRSG